MNRSVMSRDRIYLHSVTSLLLLLLNFRTKSERPLYCHPSWRTNSLLAAQRDDAAFWPTWPRVRVALLLQRQSKRCWNNIPTLPCRPTRVTRFSAGFSTNSSAAFPWKSITQRQYIWIGTAMGYKLEGRSSYQRLIPPGGKAAGAPASSIEVKNGAIPHSTKRLPDLVTNSWVRERTVPTERPPFVGKVSANLCGYRMLLLFLFLFFLLLLLLLLLLLICCTRSNICYISSLLCLLWASILLTFLLLLLLLLLLLIITELLLLTLNYC
jgi:hypothetical protein